MAKGRKPATPAAGADPQAYKHSSAKAKQRPDAGLQQEFVQRKPPKTYRYDSSLDPQLSWDESRERELGEWLLGLIAKATEEGGSKVFEKEQVWAGGSVRVQSLQAAVQLIQSLSKPFLN